MFFASKLKAKAETIPLQVWNLAHQPTATALVMPCANPALKVHLASKWHVSSNWSKLQLKTPHGCWMFLISQEQFIMNKAMPQPVDSGINVTGVVGALGATSLPSIGHDTRCLHVGRSFGHLGQTVRPSPSTRARKAMPSSGPWAQDRQDLKCTCLHFAAQDAIDVAAAQNALDDHNGVGKDSQLHRLGGSVGLRIPCCKCHAQPLRSAILGLQNWP